MQCAARSLRRLLDRPVAVIVNPGVFNDYLRVIAFGDQIAAAIVANRDQEIAVLERNDVITVFRRFLLPSQGSAVGQNRSRFRRPVAARLHTVVQS